MGELISFRGGGQGGDNEIHELLSLLLIPQELCGDSVPLPGSAGPNITGGRHTLRDLRLQPRLPHHVSRHVMSCDTGELSKRERVCVKCCSNVVLFLLYIPTSFHMCYDT